MKLSARNQFAGTVAKVTEGAVNGIVSLDVNGPAVSACITMSSIKELGLVPGKKQAYDRGVLHGGASFPVCSLRF